MPTFVIRPMRPGDEPALHAVFHASVHHLARGHYNPQQLQAWAPPVHDAAAWAARLKANRPFIALASDGATVAGFADLQGSGYIDQFFVAPAFAGQGVGRALMSHLQAQAQALGITRLWAHVSLAAEAFFIAQGFAVQARQEVQRAGVVLRNARMCKVIDPSNSQGNAEEVPAMR